MTIKGATIDWHEKVLHFKRIPNFDLMRLGKRDDLRTERAVSSRRMVSKRKPGMEFLGKRFGEEIILDAF